MPPQICGMCRQFLLTPGGRYAGEKTGAQHAQLCPSSLNASWRLPNTQRMRRTAEMAARGESLTPSPSSESQSRSDRSELQAQPLGSGLHPAQTLSPWRQCFLAADGPGVERCSLLTSLVWQLCTRMFGSDRRCRAGRSSAADVQSSSLHGTVQTWEERWGCSLFSQATDLMPLCYQLSATFNY